MTIADTDLGAFASLTRALGLTTSNEQPNPAWFTDPVGGSTSNPTGLKTILSSDDQRKALEEFVDEVLGEPDAHSDGDVTWLPLFRETDPDITVYAVLTPVTGAVHLGVGVAYATSQNAPRAAVRLHVPMFQVARGTASLPPRSDGSPPWLLVGTAAGRVEIGVDATFTDDAPVSGEPFLRGLSADLSIPTDGLSPPGLRLRLRDLQLPGATSPSTQELSVDDLGDADEVGGDLLAFVTGLLRAQLTSLDVTDPALRIAADLAGLLGLRDVPDLPPLPLSDLPERGIDALTDWVRDVLADDDARDAWLGQLADLVGGTALPDEDAVSFTIGPARLVVGLRLTPGTGGWPILTPWLRLALTTTDSPLGARVEVRADVLRADTATGTVTALPDLEAVAVFGPQSGTSPKLLASGPVRIGSLRLGLALDENRRPVPRIQLLDVDLDVGTGSASHHDLLDLSTPQAALAAADSVIADVLSDVLDDLGAAGELIASALGITPPDGVGAVPVTRLLSDPLGALAEYWAALVATPDAAREVLTDLARLAHGAAAPAVTGDGRADSPWLLPLSDDQSVALALTRSGSVLTCALRARLSHGFPDSPLGDLTVTGEVAVDLLRIDLTAGQTSFLTDVRGGMRLARTDATPLTLDLGIAQLTMSTAGVTAGWSPSTGLRITPEADLAVGWSTRTAAADIRLPLPVIGADGTITFPDEIDWDDVELAIGRLLLVPELAVLHPFVRLLGWHGNGPHLSLAALLDDPAAAVEAWVTALVLDCDVLHVALTALATVLSAGSVSAPFGLGRRGAPYRIPVGGHPQLPGLSVWSDPPCPRPAAWQRASGFEPGRRPDGDALVAALWNVADDLPELADLLTARPGLAAGLDALRSRTEDTDGLVGIPRSGTGESDGMSGAESSTVPALPDGVTGTVLRGYGHATIRAAVVVDATLVEGLDTAPATQVWVTTDRDWWLTHDADRRIDATSTAATSTTGPAAGDVTALPADGSGVWFVLLPPRSQTPPGADPIGTQADVIAGVLRDRTTPVTLIADGGPGAAALRAAARPALTATVGAVATVGTPWGPLPTTTFVGPGGQALAFLEALVAERTVIGDEQLAFFSNEFDRATALLTRMRQQRAATELTGAELEPVRPGLSVHAVFGELTADNVTSQLATLIDAAVTDRLEAATASSPADPDPDPADPADPDDPAPGTAGTSTREVHVGLGLPAQDLALGQVTLGLSADLSLIGIHASAPRVRQEQRLTVALRLGVTDGWLVGGPGAARRDIEVRWMEVLLHVPLDGDEATGELVLHEARAYEAYRERWVVRADAVTLDAVGTGLGDVATVALPEVRLILAEVIARVRAESAAMADLLTTYGLVRDGGLDPTGLDRLLFDTRAFLRDPLAVDAAGIVAALRTLLGAPEGPTPTTLRLGQDDAYVEVDLVTGRIVASGHTDPQGLPPVSATLSLPNGWLTDPSPVPEVGLTIGAGSDPVRLVATLSAAGPGVELELSAPGVDRRIPLYPAPDPAPFLDLLTTTLPAIALRTVLEALRAALPADPRTVLDAALDAVGLLDPADPALLGGGSAGHGSRRIRLPIGLIEDPGAHLRALPSPLTGAVVVLDALAEAIVPDRPADGWPVGDDARIGYAIVGARLELTCTVGLDQTIEGTAVELDLVGGLAVDLSGAITPRVGAAARVGGYGLGLTVGDGAGTGTGSTGPGTPVTLDLLRPDPAAAVRIHPAGPGLGTAVEVAAEAAVLAALDALLAARGTGTPTSTIQKVATVVDDLATGLGLLRVTGTTHTVDRDLVTAFAAAPGPWLLGRLPDLGEQVLSALATALGSPLLTAETTTAGTRLAYRETPSADPTAWLLLDGPNRAMALGADISLADIGRLRIDEIRLSSAGLSLDVTAGPLEIDLDSVTLYPLVSLRAGTVGALPADRPREVRIGLATSATGSDTVELAWTLDATPPRLRARSEGVPSEDPAVIATRALGIAVNLASGILTRELESIISADAAAKLRGVVFVTGRSIDPALVSDVLDPAALLARLKRLAWNCATVGDPLTLTIEGILEISLTSRSAGGQEHLGVTLDLAGSGSGRRRVTLVEGSLTVELEAESSWIATPDVEEGLSIRLLRGTGPDDLALVPAVTVAGLGMRFSASGAPLLDLDAISIDAISVRVYADVGPVGVGAGVQLVLDGLSVAPGGGGGSNPVANGIMNDVGAASGSARPTFSPSLAIQRAPGPGEDVGVSLRAGDPPGPWWVVIQRQVGPLYVERIGLDTSESGGKVTRISLLFTGQLELFGLTAAVDQLSLNWLGGDVLSISSWSVDLMGLAVSADLSGVSLSGGLLKIVEGGSVSYLGMLTGRFAVYGLSVFGGFTQHVNAQGGSEASFFIFGGFNGPIGGPPAFFLTGIAGGLGINRGLRVPDDLSDFGTYPFIRALNPAATPGEPMDELRKLAEYFPHQVGNFWFAGGVSFTSFSLIDGIAVLAVSFGSSGLDITLFGLARMALPRPGVALVSIELALLVRFSMSEGVFMIRAQLTDNSWLLRPEIRLTGGFAFAIWWKGPLAGQFVLTLGGYHPSFHVEGYPDVPRLGLVWRVSDVLVIKGGSYFALTSEALMAGTDVEASLDLGWVWAKVSFGAHGIVYFDPFSFDVRAYARISAGIHLDLWLTTISFSITIGAEIHVWGPDFAGEVTFEIGPATVPIRFGGSQRVAPQTLDWPAFVAKYLEQGSGSSARALTAITGRGTLPSATKGQTGAESADGTAARPFRVFAEFELTISTSIPTRTITVGTTTPHTVEPRLAGAVTQLGLAPMGLRDLRPTLRVTLSRKSGSGWTAEPSRLTPLAEGIGGSSGPAQIGTEAFPLGVFGAPQTSSTGTARLPSHEVVQAANRLLLVAGIKTDPPGPEMDYYRVEAGRRPLPLQSTRTTRATMVNLGRTLVPQVDSVSAALGTAATLLFEQGHEPHSRLARASFRTDRAAPPMFGSLTDGLIADNGPDGERERIEVPRGEAAVPRRPVVIGFLESGYGAATRPTHTTVADGRIKRRPAPSLESVRSRLATRLPVLLERSQPAPVAESATVVATAYLPRTSAATTGQTYAGSRLTAPALQGLVGGLGTRAGLVPRRESVPRASRAVQARAEALSQGIRGGDVVVLECLDARYDADPGRRPRVRISGAARVLALAGSAVAADVEVSGTQEVTVPPGTTVIAVHAGGDLDPDTGFAGWHDGSRVARLGERAALAGGCAITVDGWPLDPDQARAVTWQPAQQLIAGAREVTTRFTRPVRSIAVALTGTGPDALPESLDETTLRLIGARQGRVGRTDTDPILVVLGGMSVLVYDVTPIPRVKGAPDPSVGISVVNGAQWAVAGIVGAPVDAASLATRIAQDGLAVVTARVTAAEGSVSLEWLEAGRRTGPAPRTSATRKKSTAKKATTKKATTKKSAAKKAATKSAPAKKSTAKKATTKKTATKKATAKKTTAKKTTVTRNRGQR